MSKNVIAYTEINKNKIIRDKIKRIITVKDELKEFRTKDINDKSFKVYKPGCDDITELDEEYETLINAINYFVSFKICKLQLSSDHDYLTVTLIRNDVSDDLLKKME